jgi:hypothetical protein
MKIVDIKKGHDDVIPCISRINGCGTAIVWQTENKNRNRYREQLVCLT